MCTPSFFLNKFSTIAQPLNYLVVYNSSIVAASIWPFPDMLAAIFLTCMMYMHGVHAWCSMMVFMQWCSCCRYDSHSRYWACFRLRGDIDDARAMAVASGLLPASALPRNCAGLKRPEQLQYVPEKWTVSWTDMPLRHKKSGLVR